MAQMQGAYRLGKAIVDGITALEGQFELEGDAIAPTLGNRTMVRDAIVDAARSAGFTPLFFFLARMLPLAAERE